MRRWSFALVGLAAGLLVGVAVTGIALGESPDEPTVLPHFYETASPDSPIKTLRIDPADDRGKSGTVRGVMGWRDFEVPVGTWQVSEDHLRFQFLAPAEILQIDVSVDINDRRAHLVEFVAGINVPTYNPHSRAGDVFMHVSWSESSRSQIDETVQLPEGAAVEAGDYVGVSAYMGGAGAGDPIRVSPEIVVLYRWR